LPMVLGILVCARSAFASRLTIFYGEFFLGGVAG